MKGRFFSVLRRLVGDDARDAAERENTALRAASAPSGLPAGLAAYACAEGTTPEGMVELGRFSDVPGRAFALPVATAPVHSLVLGPTGLGKTYLLLGLLRAKLRRFACAPDAADRIVVVDPKGELSALISDVLASLLPTLPPEAAERLLSAFVVINPFSTDALVPMNLLRSDDGADVEAIAWDLVGMVANLGGAAFGTLQDAFSFGSFSLGAELARSGTGFTLVDLARLLDAPAELRRLAAASANPSVRSYFAADRLPPASLHGVRARLHRCLRLAGARRMLGARDCVSFPDLLRNRIVIVNVGDAPIGSADLRDFWTSALVTRLVRAIFSRSGEEPPVVVAIDEWQETVRAAAWLAREFERVLAIARNRRAHLILVSQSLDAVRSVSSSLPAITLTNTDLRMVFRVEDDPRAVANLLPVSGRRLRPPPAPWEERPRDPFLSPTEERAALLERLMRLPPREFFFIDRRTGGAGAFVRTSDVEVTRPRDLPAATAARLSTGALALPRERAAAPANVAAHDGDPPPRDECARPSPPSLPRRRRRL